jgi:hypothetical protein
VHDPVDIRRRIGRLFACRPPRHYGHLLARGAVVHALDEVDDIEAWRATIRRQARSAMIKIRTGFNEGVVWAMLARVPHSEELAAARRYRDLVRHAVPLAVDL